MPARRPPPPIDKATITQEPPPAPTTATPAPEAVKATEQPDDQPEPIDNHTAKMLATLGDPKALRAAIDRDLVHADDRTREQVTDFFGRTAMGDRFIQASEITGISWLIVRSYCHHHPKIRDIYEFCQDIGKQTRQCRREMNLDHRGNVGVRSPIYYKGAVVGYVLKPSDKCLELALKGGDVEGKYADRSKTESTVKGIMYHIHGVDRTPVDKLERPDILDV